MRKRSETISGATLVAKHADGIVGQVTQVMAVELVEAGESIFPYPTEAEVLRKAADAWQRTRLKPLAKLVFATFFRVLG